MSEIPTSRAVPGIWLRRFGLVVLGLFLWGWWVLGAPSLLLLLVASVLIVGSVVARRRV